MAGIYTNFLAENNQEEIHGYFFNAKFKTSFKEEVKFKNYRLGRSVLSKFLDRRFLYEDEKYVCCFEGVLNKKVLAESLINAFETDLGDYLNELSGTFTGFVFDKKSVRLSIFTDKLVVKPVYYFFDKAFGFASASEMHVVSKMLRKNKTKITANKASLYSLALFGQMYGNHTTVNEITKLNYGSILEVNLKSMHCTTISYFKISKNVKDVHQEVAAKEIEHRFINAVKEEWDIDLQAGYKKHISLMSGGMDAKTNALVAKEIGYKNITTYTYGSSKSTDVKIASKLSEENFENHIIAQLHNGKYLVENILENYIKPTDGLINYSPTATMKHNLEKINFSNYGQLHSGQAGGFVFGDCAQENFTVQQSKYSLGINGFIKAKHLIEKVTYLDKELSEYGPDDSEIFAFKHWFSNGTYFGDRVCNNYIDHNSPFYNIDLVNYNMNLPYKLKKNQFIYHTWLSKKHPQVLQYKWEKIGMKPNTKYKIFLGGIFKKYYNGAKKKFNLKYDSMNPIGNWFKKDSNLEKALNIIFETELAKLSDNELKRDLTEIYNNNIFEYRNKFAVISTLLSLKLHFEDEA